MLLDVDVGKEVFPRSGFWIPGGYVLHAKSQAVSLTKIGEMCSGATVFALLSSQIQTRSSNSITDSIVALPRYEGAL